MAPRGTIDAGDAGIRVSGNAVIIAAAVRNAGNITIQGTSTGLPTIQAPNIGGLTAASNASGAATKVDTPADGANTSGQRPSVIIVEIMGFGGGDGDSEPQQKEQQRDHREL
jgi:hypothetical protein